MAPSFLLTHFDRLAEAPGGLAKLRALVLRLAVTGKVIPQNPSDEAAASLIDIKDQEEIASNDSDTLPEGWIAVRLGKVLALKKGKNPKNFNTEGVGLPYLDIAALERGELRRFTEDSDCPRATAGDLVIVCDGSRSGLVLDGRKGILGSTVASISFKGFDRGFLKVLLSALYDDLNGAMKGAAIPHLNIPRFLNLQCLLPPLAEQRRIVAKVEELMGLCDALEAAQQERETVRTRLRTSALHQLASPDSDSKSATAFFLKHMPLLSAASEDVLSFRQLVLQLAIQGKLTNSQLQYPKGDRDSDDIPFCIPVDWKWGTIRDICESSFYGPRFGKDEYTDKGIPTIRTTDMTDDGRIALKNPPRVLVANQERIEVFKCRKGDLLVTRTGSIGIMAIFDGDYLAIPSAYLIRFRFKELAAPEFVHVLLRAPYGFSQLGLGTTKVAQPNINSETIKSIPIPLPPLAEQRRIVAKVDELMAVLDALAATLTTARTTAERLLAATIARLHAA